MPEYCGRTGKLVHEDAAAAHAHRRSLGWGRRDRRRRELRVYRCDACGGFHVGNNLRKDMRS